MLCRKKGERQRKLTCSLFIFIAPTATILGGPDFYVQKGSTINLTCSIRLGPEESPAFIFWYHEEEVFH